MPRYEYAARDESGLAITGEIVANTRVEAARLLRKEGKFIVRLIQGLESQSPAATQTRSRGGRIRSDQVIFFANQLSVMVDTGVPLADALQATIEDEPTGRFRDIVTDVIERIRAGQAFSAALEHHPRVFPRFFCSIIRASEASGLLGTMLQRVALYMTNQRETRKRVIRAVTYPAVMLGLCVTVMIGILTVLMPRFTKIYEQRRVELPVPTKVLITISHFLATNWFWILLATAAGIFLLMRFLRTPTGYKMLSWLKIHLPIVGPMYRKSCLSRCMRTMGTLIDSGVSMLDTITIAQNTVENHFYEAVFDRVYERLQKGNLLSDSLRGSALFPHSVVQMVLAGERSGQMGPVMNRVADFCDQDLRHEISSVTQLIEPMLVVVMGILIGGAVIAMLLPILRLSTVISGINNAH